MRKIILAFRILFECCKSFTKYSKDDALILALHKQRLQKIQKLTKYNIMTAHKLFQIL